MIIIQRALVYIEMGTIEFFMHDTMIFQANQRVSSGPFHTLPIAQVRTNQLACSGFFQCLWWILFPIIFPIPDFFTCEVKFHALPSSCSKQIYEGLHQLGNVPFDSAFSISLLKYDSDSPLNPCKYAVQSSSIKSPSSLYGARKRISSTSEYLNL
jgi:hypothetical protein